jgi:hypothetical protein
MDPQVGRVDDVALFDTVNAAERLGIQDPLAPVVPAMVYNCWRIPPEFPFASTIPITSVLPSVPLEIDITLMKINNTDLLHGSRSM